MYRGQRRCSGRSGCGSRRAAGRRRLRRLPRGLDAVPGMYEAIETAVRRKGRPFLGICVGMQLMAERGLEFRVTPGFGWIKGDVTRHRAERPDAEDPAHGLEHAGRGQPAPSARRIETGRADCTPISCTPSISPRRTVAAVVAETNYGGPVTAMVGADNIAGTQFHPEKSQTLGLRLISNFLKWRPLIFTANYFMLSQA